MHVKVQVYRQIVYNGSLWNVRLKKIIFFLNFLCMSLINCQIFRPEKLLSLHNYSESRWFSCNYFRVDSSILWCNTVIPQYTGVHPPSSWLYGTERFYSESLLLAWLVAGMNLYPEASCCNELPPWWPFTRYMYLTFFLHVFSFQVALGFQLLDLVLVMSNLFIKLLQKDENKISYYGVSNALQCRIVASL